MIRSPTISRNVAFAIVVAVLCATVLHSRFQRPLLSGFAGLVVLVMIQVARRMLEHERFVRSLQRYAWDGSLAGEPVRHVHGLAPLAAGLLHPHVYCDPALVARLTPRQQRAVVLHERCHVRRRDPLRLQLGNALRPVAGLWPGLRAYLDAREVAQEIAADRHALDNGATRTDIAGALLAVLDSPGALQCPGFASAMEARLRALHDGDVDAMPTQSAPGIGAGLATLVIVACLVVF